MTGPRYSAELAASEYMLEGNPLTRLESMVLFGVSSHTSLIRRMRKAGWVIESRKISYAAVLQRMKGKAQLAPPRNLPIRDIWLADNWVSK